MLKNSASPYWVSANSYGFSTVAGYYQHQRYRG